MKRSILFVLLGILFFPNIIHSQCAPFHPGYINIGQLNGHNYYLSIVNAKPTDAQAAAEALGGYLAVIDNEEEDDFILNFIDELTYIGLNDAATEGTFEWLNGDLVGYTNIDPCGFCTSNADDQDYVVKEPWGAGGWSFSNFWNARKYIVEIPCGMSNTDCAFSNILENPNYFYPGTADKVIETTDGFEMRFEGFGVGTRRLTKWFINSSGQTISTSDIEMPYPAGMGFGRFSTLDDYFFMHGDDGLDVVFQKVDFSGNTVWTNIYQVNYTATNLNYATSRDAWEDTDGILITGHAGNGGSIGGVRQPFLIKTDLDGNEQWQILLPDEDRFISLNVISRSIDGGYYLRMSFGDPFPEKIIKIDANGNIQWTHETEGNVNNVERVFAGEGADGTGFFYTQYVSFVSTEVKLIKLNPTTGGVAWEKNVGSEFNQPFPTYDYVHRGVLATNDGGVIVQYVWSLTGSNGNTFADIGNHYGKFDNNGDIVWDYELPRFRTNFHVPTFITNDNGILFSGTSQNDRKFVWKYTSEGWNAPICGSSPTGLQVNCDLNIDPNDLQVDESDPVGNIVNWTPPTATTDCPGGIVSIEQISGQSSGSFFAAWTTFDHIVVYKITDACGNEEVCVTEFEVSGIYGNIVCPDDIVVEATSADGAIVNFGLPIITPSTCIPGVPSQVSGPTSGSVFPIGTTEIQFLSFFGGSNTYCQNSMTCAINITVNPMNTGGGCPGDFSGFTTLGEFGDSKYYISNDASRPVDAQAVAESNGGYLAAISSQEENDFIQQNISDMVYIGLNDYDSEGNLEWFNGEAFTFDNVNPCGFCNENSDEMDFVIMAPWNGEWSFSNFWNQRKYIMEIPCGGNTGGGDCAFITEVGANPSQTEIVKTTDGYQVQMLTSSFDIDYREVDLDNNGITTSINNVAPDMPNSSTYFKDENFYTTYPMLDGLSFDLSAYQVDGTPKWSSIFEINTIDPLADDLVGLNTVDVGDGIMIFGVYHFGNAATWRRFVIKIDYDGNEIFQNTFDVLNDFPSILEVQAGADGGIYFLRRSGSASGFFGKISGSGELVWENSVIGDLVTNKMYLVGETPDEQFVYLSVADNNSYRAYVRKYNVITGDEIWEVDLNEVFSPGRTGTTFGYRGAAVTPDGGIIASITYTDFFNFNKIGTEYGRLDANGNLMWWKDAPIGFGGMVANSALSDGSLFFTKNNSGNTFTIIRMNEDGTFDPSCTNGNLPDLDMANMSFYTPTLQTGQTYNVEFEIHNNNLGTAPQYEVGVYLLQYEFNNPNPAEYLVNSYSYSDTEFGFFETDLDFVIPNNTNIPEGQYSLKLVIDYENVISESNEDNNTIQVSGVFDLEINGGGDLPDLTVSNLASFTNSGATGEVVLFNFDLNNIGTITASGDYNINMYISTDEIFSADDVLVGEVPTGDTPVGTIANVPGAITVPNLSDGNYFLIIVADALEEIEESNKNNNTLTTSFEIGSGGGCPTSLTGFITLGEFNGSAYFLSDDALRPLDAQALAESNGGYLAAISSQEENDFIQQYISEMTYIGLNDYDTEGNLEWFNGEAFTFDNINPCSFCNENSGEMDFVIMAPWNGEWSFSNFWNQRKYIIEIPCSSTLIDPNIGNSFVAQNSNQLNQDRLMIEKLYPNPAGDFIYTTIQSSIEQEIELQILDARGSLIKAERVNLMKGLSTIELSITDLPNGVYSVFIPQKDGINKTLRFVKM